MSNAMADTQPPSGGGQLGEIPHVRLPRPELLFSRRAERFTALAPGHTLSEYLELLARLAAVQLTAYETIAALPPPGRAPETGEDGRPLDAGTHRRDASWRDALRVIVTELSVAPMPAESRAALDALRALGDTAVEAIAGRVLANAVEGADLAAGLFVAAALQVYFASLASQLRPGGVPRARNGCPVCGSLPVAGIVLGDDRLRYLVCSLCGTQWHETRVQCAACHQGKDIAYFQLEGDRAASLPPQVAAAVKAEACPACKAYTKLFYVEKDPKLEPFADDVASLALDLLMAEDGWQRYGVNLFLVPAIDPASVRRNGASA